MLGLFILGLVTSLAIVHAYINPRIDLSGFVMLTVLIIAIVMMIASLYAIKHTTALFTKKLLEYKFNKSSFLYDMTYGKTFFATFCY